MHCQHSLVAMINLFLICFSFFIFIFSSTCSASNSNSSVNSSHTVIFVSIPLPGHINPLLIQAEELSRRGWIVYISSCSSASHHITRSRSSDKIQFLDMGVCEHDDSERQSVLNEAASTIDPAASTSVLVQWTFRLFPSMYNGLMSQISKLHLKPNIFVVDLATASGFDVAEQLKIPFIVNNADLLHMISFEVIEAADYIPQMNLFTSVHDLGTNTAIRTLMPLIRAYVRLLLKFTIEKDLNTARALVGLKPISMLQQLSKQVILVNNAFGLEYIRHLPPQVMLTGPMLDLDRPMTEYTKELNKIDVEYIESDSRPVIFVSQGTISPLTEDRVNKMLLAFTSEKYRVLWKLSKNDQIHLPSTIPSNIHITEWVSSQLGVLSHNNVKVFVSHCGVNSAHESIWLKTPLICIPIIADQSDMALRVSDAKVGFALNKNEFTVVQLKEAIDQLLNNNTFIYNINRVQSMFKLHGGLKQTANMIETVAEYGSDMFIPMQNYYPWYAYYGFDVYCIWMIIGFGIYKSFTLCNKSKTQCVDGRKIRDRNDKQD